MQPEEPEEEPRFLAFKGTGRRLDGKAAVGGPPVPVDPSRGIRRPPAPAAPSGDIHVPGAGSMQAEA